MAARASVTHQQAAEGHVTEPESKVDGSPQVDHPNKNNGSVTLSAHQRNLLAGFGTLSPGAIHHLESVGRESNRQDCEFPACQVTHKETATSPFLPTFIQPHQNILSRPRQFNMALGSFDPSRYGAPPKKQRPNVTLPSQQGLVKTATAKPPELEAASMPAQDRTSRSITHSTVSDTSYRARSFNTQPTEAANAAKPVGENILKPKPTNRVLIPGFDPLKYGKSNLRMNQSITDDEASVNTSDKAGNKTSVQNSLPAIGIHAASGSQGHDLASVNFQPRPQLQAQLLTTEISQEHTGTVNDDNSSPVINNTWTGQRAPDMQIASTEYPQVNTPELTSSTLPPPLPGMSKEERLKQVQQARMRQIGLRNRTKRNVPETTSLKDLHVARAVTPSVPESPAPVALASPEHTPAIIASEITSSWTLRSSNNGSAPIVTSSTLPPPLPGMTKEARLKQLQQARLREIGFRNRGDGRTPETTSLVDLNLARTPARSEIIYSTAVPSPSLGASNPTAALPPPQGAVWKTCTIQPDTEHTQGGLAASGPANVLPKKSRNPRWCTKDDVRAEPRETESNAWGSNIPSNASVASNDSIRPMQLHGKLFKGPPAGENEEVEALVGWDGKMQPPPVDWNDRPRFNNNSPAFKNGFNNWMVDSAHQMYEFVDRTPMFRQIPYHLVENVELHADGIGMIRRDYTLNAHNISKYGYDDDSADVAKYAEAVAPEDFEDWGKLDLSEPDNARFKDETTEQLVKNWRIHWENSRKSSVPLAVLPGHKAGKEDKVSRPEPNPNKPSVNIYIRPAVKSDIKQMTDLYNWWVENSVRTAETRIIEVSDMRERFDNSKGDDRLPFVVAILKGKKDVPRHHFTGVKGEQIVGFALATGFTAADYVEHIAAELEIYVHHKFLRQGIGRCLLDRLMCATDRGHMERGGYPFHCDPAERHWYEVGGARDLHKVMFVARHHSRPKKDSFDEMDITSWMKKWLVKDWDFEQEACLKQIGAKNGRFLDVTYFSKFTKWLPEEGRVPEPDPKDYKHGTL